MHMKYSSTFTLPPCTHTTRRRARGRPFFYSFFIHPSTPIDYQNKRSPQEHRNAFVFLAMKKTIWWIWTFISVHFPPSLMLSVSARKVVFGWYPRVLANGLHDQELWPMNKPSSRMKRRTPSQVPKNSYHDTERQQRYIGGMLYFSSLCSASVGGGAPFWPTQPKNIHSPSQFSSSCEQRARCNYAWSSIASNQMQSTRRTYLPGHKPTQPNHICAFSLVLFPDAYIHCKYHQLFSSIFFWHIPVNGTLGYDSTAQSNVQHVKCQNFWTKLPRGIQGKKSTQLPMSYIFFFLCSVPWPGPPNRDLFITEHSHQENTQIDHNFLRAITDLQVLM